MPKPIVTVVIPTRNQLRYLRQAVGSVRRQTAGGWELLVVDDASTDGTSAWCRENAGSGLRCLRLPRRKGTPGARNAGIVEAKGELIAFLDHDDLWYPRYLEVVLPLFRRPETMMSACAVDLVDSRGRRLRRREGIDESFFAATGLAHTPCMSACVLRRRVFRDIGLLDEGFTMLDDLDLFYRVAARYGRRAITCVDRPLAAYRRHPSQQTAVYEGVRDGAALVRGFLKTGARRGGQRACLLDMAYFYAKHADRVPRKA